MAWADKAVLDLEKDKFVQTIDGETAVRVSLFEGFEIGNFDDITITYVAAGNGVGEIETVTYLLASSTVAVLTLSYNGDDKLSRVQRTT